MRRKDLGSSGTARGVPQRQAEAGPSTIASPVGFPAVLREAREGEESLLGRSDARRLFLRVPGVPLVYLKPETSPMVSAGSWHPG